MATFNEIKECLNQYSNKYPNIVSGRLDRGSKVSKSMGLRYIIDDIDIDKRLGDFPEGAIPYGPIHRALKSSMGGILKVFDKKSEAMFSRAYEEGIGECLEKAILVQLSAQKGRDAFLINGVLELDESYKESGVNSHAYNVIFKDGKPFLVDAQNPLAKDKDDKITKPYIAPILDLTGENGEFIVPDEWKQGRRYFIS